jgi:uncharacterized membrane protein
MGRASAIHNDIICDIILNKQQKWAYQCERLEQPRTKKQKMSSYYSNQPNANVYQAAENYYDPYSTTVPTYQPVAYSSSTAPLINIEEGKSDETNALILFIIGFFFGGIILWLIVYFVYRNSVNSSARKIAKISGVMSILILIVGVIAVAIWLVIWLFIVLG